jgi:hypothetical protein
MSRIRIRCCKRGITTDPTTDDRVDRVMLYGFSQVSGYCEELFTISRSSGVKLL